jgi:hypothetical protein
MQLTRVFEASSPEIDLGVSLQSVPLFVWYQKLRQLLDELFEHALEGEPSSWRQTTPQVLEGAASRR